MARFSWQRAGRWLLKLAPLAAVLVALASWRRVPHVQLEPVVLGLICWSVGTFIFCPLRWRAVSSAGQPFRWYSRVYAEGELLGMLTPQHAGADLWRIRQLGQVGKDRPAALVEVVTDRLSGGVAIVGLAVVTGATLPARTLEIIGLVLALAAVGATATRALWVPRVRELPRPRPSRIARGAVMSLGYQFANLGFTIGLVAAVGHHVDPLPTLSLLGLSQLAGLLPGLHGAGPKEGTLATGLVSLGVPLAASVGVVALASALAWVPAVLVGGGSLALGGLRPRQVAQATSTP